MQKPKSILVIDDDPGMLQTLHYILSEKGYEVVTVNNGPEALGLISKKSFDIVLSDIKMPGMTGVDVLEQIKSRSPQTKVMMITAYTMHELVEEAKKRGAHAIFSKPLDFDKILPCIDGYAAQAQPESPPPPAPNDLFEILQNKEQELEEKTRLVNALKKELSEIRHNPGALLEQERKRVQSENIQDLLNPKQLALFEIISRGRSSYPEILAKAQERRLDIRDLPALRLQMSRLEKKLEKETNFIVEKIRVDKTLYFKISAA